MRRDPSRGQGPKGEDSAVGPRREPARRAGGPGTAGPMRHRPPFVLDIALGLEGNYFLGAGDDREGGVGYLGAVQTPSAPATYSLKERPETS